MSRFQLILLGVLVVATVAGAIVFASMKRNTKSQDAEEVVVWGTVPATKIGMYFDTVSNTNRQSVNIAYVYKQPASFERDLIEAIADRKGPDGIILPDNLVYRLKEKIAAIPFVSYAERSFKNSFISAEEIYLSPEGVLGFPLSIDPIVLYWNRDLLSSGGFSKPPSSWEELFIMAPKLTKKDSVGNIYQSAIALGDLSNVAHGKEILATLMFQAGINIVSSDGLRLQSNLVDRKGSIVPAEEALRFFTEFVNPSKDSYTWNRSLPNSFNAFVGGQLAMYIGYASEFSQIHDKNPNLNFDVAEIPQADGAIVKSTYGASLALAILKSSSKISAAALAFSTLTTVDSISEWVKNTGLPPARRDLLSMPPLDSIASVFNKSAIISRTWLDPNPTDTGVIFFKMVDEVASGRSRISTAVTDAHQNLSSLIK